MLEVKLDEELKKYTVSPISKGNSDGYVIICKNEYEAKSLCTQIAMGMIPSPNNNPLKYKSSGIHPDGNRRIYSMK